MRKSLLKEGWKPPFFLASILLAILAIFFAATKAPDTSSDFAQLEILREIRELDTGWELDVLRSKSGIRDNYDALADPLAGLEQLLQRLQGDPRNAGSDNDLKLRHAQDEIRSAFQIKVRLIETFKSHNAILNNSLFFMPEAAEDFRNALRAAPASASARRARMVSLTNAVRDCLIFAMAPSADTHARIETELRQLRSMGVGLGGPAQSSLEIFLSHAGKVLHEKPLVDSVLRKIAAVPTGSRLGEAQRILLDRDREINRQAQEYREYLLLFSAALAGLLLTAAVGLLRSNATIRQINVALKSESEAKSRFIANISHELRTPLASIISYAELMREVAEEEQRNGDVEDLDVIIRSAKHLLTLISEILDFAKLSAGRIKVEIAEFACQELLSVVQEIAEPLAATNGNRLDLVAGPELGSLRSDQFRLQQCLLNLASNAAKFTKNGVIGIGARREVRGGRDGVRFQVRDTGIGMSAEVVSQLFQPFRQGEDSIARRFGGTGLGLAITRELMRLLGGEIDVESRPGEGTSFSLWIPADSQARPAPADPHPQSGELLAAS